MLDYTCCPVNRLVKWCIRKLNSKIFSSWYYHVAAAAVAIIARYIKS